MLDQMLIWRMRIAKAFNSSWFDGRERKREGEREKERKWRREREKGKVALNERIYIYVCVEWGKRKTWMEGRGGEERGWRGFLLVCLFGCPSDEEETREPHVTRASLLPHLDSFNLSSVSFLRFFSFWYLFEKIIINVNELFLIFFFINDHNFLSHSTNYSHLIASVEPSFNQHTQVESF